jgi:ribonuclease D
MCIFTKYKTLVLKPNVKENNNFILIENDAALRTFADQHQKVTQIGIDTEFVGEKRYKPLICLIQTSSEIGNFIIDPLSISNLSPFLELIENPAILKITHAGDNDYRGFYQNYGILPKNIFDTQIASAFLDFKYPISFKKLVDTEFSYQLDKSHTVTQWDNRPLSRDQLQYALDDVLPLLELYRRMTIKLIEKGRLSWAQEEFKLLELSSSYSKIIENEVITNPIIYSLSQNEKIFYLRLMVWRENMAKDKNVNRDMIIPAKYIHTLVKGIKSGRNYFKDNRRFPINIPNDYWKFFDEFFKEKPTDKELNILSNISKEPEEDLREEALIDLIYGVIKYYCMENGISASIAFPKNMLKQMRLNEESQISFSDGWRSAFFGSEFNDILCKKKDIKVTFKDDSIIIQ